MIIEGKAVVAFEVILYGHFNVGSYMAAARLPGTIVLNVCLVATTHRIYCNRMRAVLFVIEFALTVRLNFAAIRRLFASRGVNRSRKFWDLTGGRSNVGTNAEGFLVKYRVLVGRMDLSVNIGPDLSGKIVGNLLVKNGSGLLQIGQLGPS